MPTPGTVFQVIPEGGNHFWIVVSTVRNGLVLAVNITDIRNCPDSPCVIEVGEHPAVTKRSVVFYRKAREFDAGKIDLFLAGGTQLRQLPDCSADLLARIIQGAKVADDLTLRFLDYLT
jgi:hypothetical protein